MHLNDHIPAATKAAIRLLHSAPPLPDLVAEQGASLTDVLAQIARLDEAAKRQPVLHSTGATTVRDKLINGDPLTDLVALFEGDAMREAAHVYATRELTRLKSELTSQAATLASQILEQAPSFLHTRLTEMVGKARALRAKAGKLTSAQQAIDANRTAEWKQWTALVESYEAIRATQRILIMGPLQSHYQRPGDDMWVWVSLVENAEELDEAALMPQRVNHQPPWLDFAWLIDTEHARPWVPTPEQASARAQALIAARTEWAKQQGRPVRVYSRPEEVGYKGSAPNFDIPHVFD